MTQTRPWSAWNKLHWPQPSDVQVELLYAVWYEPADTIQSKNVTKRMTQVRRGPKRARAEASQSEARMITVGVCARSVRSRTIKK